MKRYPEGAYSIFTLTYDQYMALTDGRVPIPTTCEFVDIDVYDETLMELPKHDLIFYHIADMLNGEKA